MAGNYPVGECGAWRKPPCEGIAARLRDYLQDYTKSEPDTEPHHPAANISGRCSQVAGCLAATLSNAELTAINNGAKGEK